MTKTLYYINVCPGARAVRLFSRYSKIHMNEKLILIVTHVAQREPV